MCFSGLGVYEIISYSTVTNVIYSFLLSRVNDMLQA